MTDVATILDDWFITTREERPPDGNLHPSSLSGCWRQAVYEAQGVAPSDEKAVRSLRIMWFGTALHEMLQKALWSQNGFIAEVKVQPDGWPLSGSADGIRFTDDDPPEYELLEFKSISPFQLKRKDFTEAKPHHIRQARMYAWGLRKLDYLVTSIRIVYISRDDMQMREFVIDVSSQWEREFEEELRLSKDLFLGEGKLALPPRLDDDDDTAWLCKYCSYRTRCWTQDSDTRRVD